MIKVYIFSGIQKLEEGLNQIEKYEHGSIMQILVHTIPGIEYLPNYTVIYRVKNNERH